MQRSRIPLTNFQYGEISTALSSRTDSQIYTSSAQSVKNFFIMSEGGLQKRGGFKALHDFDDITVDTAIKQQIRLIPFNFSEDERYIVALSDARCQVFYIDPSTGAISSAADLTQDVDSVNLPWDETIIHEITFAQGADVMFLCHSSFMPQQLIRTGLKTFEVEKFAFQVQAGGSKIYQPYFNFQKDDVTLDPSATTGSGITLTTSANYFDTGEVTTADVAAGSFVTNSYYKIDTVGTTDFTAIGANSNTVGEIFKATGAGSGTGLADLITKPKHIDTHLYYHDAQIKITHVRTATVAVGNITDELVVKLDSDAFRTTDGSTTVQVTMVDHGLSSSDSITIRDAIAVGGISASNLNGSRTVSGIVDDNVFEFTAGGSSNSSEDGGGLVEVVTHAATKTWYEQSYSDIRGYPHAVGFHENRLWFGGTTFQPDTVWASKTGLFYNFDLGEGFDSEGIELNMSIGEVSTIRHFVSNRDIHIFTDSSEFYIPAFQQQPITPSNASVKRQTAFGSTFARPQPFYGASLFVQNGGKAVRQFVYNDREDAYQSDPISLLSPHLVKNPIQSAVTISEVGASDAAIFYLNDDGTIVTYNLNRVENVAGWTRIETSGKFESIVSVADKLYAVLNEDMGSGTNSYILCELDEELNLDCANTYTGTAGVFDVSDFFENGAVVDVVEGVNYLGTFTVSSGNVDVSAVDATLTSCEVGFKFDIELKTNPIDTMLQIGPMTGRPRTLGSVIINLSDTLSLSVNGNRMILFRTNTIFANGRKPFTGNKEFRLLGYSREPQITLTQTAPLSLQVNGLVAEVTF